MDPSQVSTEVACMRERSAVCRAVMSGTSGMRRLGRIYLPQFPQEENEGWDARCNSTFLFPATAEAIKTAVGKPLGSPIVTENVPTLIEPCLEDVDLAGRDLDSWARDVMSATLRDGITWAMVDYPRLAPNATRADELALKARPYLIHVPLESMLGWKVQRMNGRLKVVQVRYTVKEDDECYVYQWEPGVLTVWKKDKEAWTVDPAQSGEISFPAAEGIPIVVFYSGRTGFWTAHPPFEDMAWKNIEHWQSSSDQRHILHVARVPLLAADEDHRVNTEAAVKAGPDGILTGFTNLHYVETTGAAIEAGAKDIATIEDQMQRLAGEIVSTEVAKTANQSKREDRAGSSQLRAWAWTFQDALEECLRIMALWVNEKDGGSVVLETDWDDEELGADMMTALNNLQTAGNLSRSSVVWTLKQKGYIPPERSVEDELALIDGEAPPPLPTTPLPLTPPTPTP